MGKRKKVLVVGGVSYDSIIYIDEFFEPENQTVFSSDYKELVGSTGSGKAFNLCKLGFDVVLHSMLGEDLSGDKIKKIIKRKKNIKLIYDKDPQGTESHTNIMDKHGERIAIFTKYQTFEPAFNYSKLEKYIAKSDFVILNIINYVRNLIPIAKKYNKEIWCDIHDYDLGNEYYNDFIEVADYILFSSNKIKDHKGLMKKLIDQGKKMVICTHGKDGAEALTATNEYIKMPAIRDYKLVDSNGAGDSFFSGLLYSYSKGYSLEKSLRIATIVAGLCISQHDLAHGDLSEKMVEQEYNKYFNS